MSAPTETWGPTVTGGRRRRGRTVLIVVVVLLLLVPLVYAGAVAFVTTNNIARAPVEGLESGSGPMHVLVVGSDSRAGMSEEERIELTTGSAEGERTDTIFVLSVKGGKAGLLAFPRDLFVERCDGSTGRINAAFQLGGASCLVQTVSQLSGLPIRHFVSVNFLGFRDIVDAVGGVEVCLDRAIQDASAGIDLPAGCQVLAGDDALGYVRVRKIDNDLERIKRQQGFIKALADRILSPDTLVNPLRTLRTASEIGSALTADEDLGVLDLARLGLGMRGLAAGNAVTETVPGTPANRGGAAVLIPDEEAAAEIFASFRDGSAFGATTEVETTVDRDDAPVTVLNGAGVAGAAGDTADALEAAGWTIAEIGNAEPRETTTVLYPPELRAAAELLRDDLPLSVALEEDTGAGGLTLVLGADVAG